MAGKLKLEIVESVETLSRLFKQERNSQKKERIQALYWIKTNLDVTYKVVHDTVRYRLKAKLKVPRRTNVKKDVEAEAEFKKNSRDN